MESIIKTKNLKPLEVKLRERAKKSRRKSWIFLGLLISALVAGGFIFVYAGGLAQKEILYYESIFFPVKDELRLLDSEYLRLEKIRREVLKEAKEALKKIDVDTEGMSEEEIIGELHVGYDKIMQVLTIK